jgi:hypothetical protein
MLRRLLLYLCIILLPLMIINAQQNPPDGEDRYPGLNLYCYLYGNPADECTVRCYNAYSGLFITAGFTNDLNYPPYFNHARFADPILVNPPWAIPSGDNVLYGFYAKKLVGSNWMYSNWSRVLKYPYYWYEDYDYLNLNRYDPPPINDLIQASPNH